MDDDSKMSKMEANYHRGTYGHHCGICNHYTPTRCSLVIGFISPSASCRLFSKNHDREIEPTIDKATRRVLSYHRIRRR